MELNADFKSIAIVHAGKEPWVKSPMAGVERRMLDRLGGEVARATTIVRYAPGSHFSPHTHTGGEEFLVLEGVFQDEHGDFPIGTYVRNPPESSHTPGSEPGCTIFVKLWQFDPEDRHQLAIEPDEMSYVPHRDEPGISVAQLFADKREVVSMERWQAGTIINLASPGGLELLVIDGKVSSFEQDFSNQSWLRLPVGGNALIVANTDATVWIKRGHLMEEPSAPSL